MSLKAVYTEGLDVMLKSRASVNWHLGLPAIALGMLLINWPEEDFTSYLSLDRAPQVFPAVTIAAAIYALILTINFGYERAAWMKGYALSWWIKYTPCRIGQYWTGRILLAATHSVMIVLLVLPFLLTAAATGGQSLGRVCLLAAFLAAVLLAVRLVALALVSYETDSPFLPFLLSILALSAYVMASPTQFPRSNPGSLLLALATEEDPSLLAPLWRGNALTLGIVTALATLTTGVRLLRAWRRLKKDTS